jgi:type 1 fimbriae regulatory protein FimB
MAIQSLEFKQVLKLLAAAKACRHRDWLMILVAFRHGLRASEVVAIKSDDVKDGFLTVQRLKGSNKTTQALVADSNPLLDEREPLIDFARRISFGERLFPIRRGQFYRIVRKHGIAAGIPIHLCHPHVLKHTVAMLSLNNNAKIHEVRTHLGHKSGASTMEYLKVSDAAASEAVAKALIPRQTN